MEYGSRDMERQQRQKDTMKQSEAILHDRQISNLGQKEMTGWKPGQEENNYDTKVHEIMNLEHAYGNVVLGVNRKQEYMFLTREKKRYHAPTIKTEQKNLEGNRKKVLSTHFGICMTNSHNAKESAAAIKVQAGTSPNQLIDTVNWFAQAKDQKGLREALPYTNIQEEKVQIKMLEARAREFREEHTARSVKEADQLETELQELRHALWQKQQMKEKIDKKLKTAIKYPSKWLDDRIPIEEFMATICKETPEDGNDDDDDEDGNKDDCGAEPYKTM